jgi:excisionase family DNA binding protein
MPEKLYTTGEVAKIFGVSYVAVKNWAHSGKIKYIRTPDGKYWYPESEIRRLLGERILKGKVAVYVRVSSADQKEDSNFERKIMCGASPVHPENPPMIREEKG